MQRNGTARAIVAAIVVAAFAAIQGLSFWILTAMRSDIKEIATDQRVTRDAIHEIDVKIAGIVTRHDLEDRLKPKTP